MYACGLRIGEATRLEIRSVDRARQVLRINGNGDKERLVLTEALLTLASEPSTSGTKEAGNE
jgi:site-specific recombinase XerD